MASPNLSYSWYKTEQGKGRYKGVSYSKWRNIKNDAWQKQHAARQVSRHTRILQEAEQKQVGGYVYVRETGQSFKASSYHKIPIERFRTMAAEKYVIYSPATWYSKAGRAKPQGTQPAPKKPTPAFKDIAKKPSLPPGEQRAIDSGQAVYAARTTDRGFVYTAATPRAAKILTAEAIEVQEKRAVAAERAQDYLRDEKKQIDILEAQGKVKEQIYTFGGLQKPVLVARPPQTDLEKIMPLSPIPSLNITESNANKQVQALEQFRSAEDKGAGYVGSVRITDKFTSRLSPDIMKKLYQDADFTFGEKVIQKGIGLTQKAKRGVRKFQAPESDLKLSQELAQQKGITGFETKLVEGAQKLPFSMAEGAIDIASDVALTGAGLAFPSTRKRTAAELLRTAKATPAGMLATLPDIRYPETIIPFTLIAAGGVQLAGAGKIPKPLKVPSNFYKVKPVSTFKFKETIRTPFGEKGLASRTTVVGRDTHTITELKAVGKMPVVQVTRGQTIGKMGFVRVNVKGDIFTQLSKADKVTVIKEPKIIAEIPAPPIFKTAVFSKHDIITSEFKGKYIPKPLFQPYNRGRFKSVFQDKSYLNFPRDILKEKSVKVSTKTVTGKFDINFWKKLEVKQDIVSTLNRQSLTKGTQVLDFSKMAFKVVEYGKSYKFDKTIGTSLKPLSVKGTRPELIFGDLQPPKDTLHILDTKKFQFASGKELEVIKFSGTKGSRIIREIYTTPKIRTSLTIQTRSRIPEHMTNLKDLIKDIDYTAPFRGKAGQIATQERLMPKFEKIQIGQRLQFGRQRSLNMEAIDSMFVKPKTSLKLIPMPISIMEVETKTDTDKILNMKFPTEIKSRTKTETRTKDVFEPVSIPVSRVESLLRQKQQVKTKAQTKQQMRTSQITDILTRNIPRTQMDIRIPTIPPPPPPPKIPPPFIFEFDLDGEDKKKRPVRKGKRQYQYSADISSMMLGIKKAGAVPQGMLSGLASRPIITEPRRKRRKK